MVTLAVIAGIKRFDFRIFGISGRIGPREQSVACQEPARLGTMDRASRRLARTITDEQETKKEEDRQVPRAL